jgi:hypothetical protein
MIFIVSQFLFIFFALIGLIVWSYSDMPLAMREIAINTRKDREQGSSYTLMRILSICLKIFAVLLWILGVASIVALNAAGSAFGGLFQGGPSL